MSLTADAGTAESEAGEKAELFYLVIGGLLWSAVNLTEIGDGAE